MYEHHYHVVRTYTYYPHTSGLGILLAFLAILVILAILYAVIDALTSRRTVVNNYTSTGGYQPAGGATVVNTGASDLAAGIIIGEAMAGPRVYGGYGGGVYGGDVIVEEDVIVDDGFDGGFGGGDIDVGGGYDGN